MADAQQALYHLSVALAVGLLIGVERGWKERDAAEGRRIAGVRTYALIGLLGGVCGLLALHLGPLPFGLAFLALAAILATAHALDPRRPVNQSITGLVAALLTFGLGALAAAGEVTVAAAVGVVATLILSAKPLLHRWVNALEAGELRAGIKLLLMSVVLLPILPDRGFGPWQALNPHAIWWMVVLIAGLSFLGYFAMKIGGAHRGILFTGLFGGLASSTAVTLHLSRLSRTNRAVAPVVAAGILVACGIMFLRVLLVAGLINPDLLRPLAPPVVAMALALFLPALLYWRAAGQTDTGTHSVIQNPLELGSALTFGLLLALVLVVGRALQEWFGDAGLLALAAASGVADVDAITLSLARMSRTDLLPAVAVTGVVIATVVNTLVKGGMAAVVGSRAAAWRVGLPLLAAAALGVLLALR